jgi:hypothetical protein
VRCAELGGLDRILGLGKRYGATPALLEFTESAEAEQYHASEAMQAAVGVSDQQLASADSIG